MSLYAYTDTDNLRGIAMDRTHDIRAFLVKELKWLRRDGGATWKRYAATRLLSSMVGGDETDYAEHLKTVIATYAKDGRQEYNTLVCLNLEGSDTSEKVTVRRAASAHEQGIGESTVMNDENTVFNQIAKGLVSNHPENASYFYEREVLRRRVDYSVDVPPQHDEPDAISITRTLIEKQEAVVATEQGKLEKLKAHLHTLENAQTP